MQVGFTKQRPPFKMKKKTTPTKPAKSNLVDFPQDLSPRAAESVYRDLVRGATLQAEVIQDNADYSKTIERWTQVKEFYHSEPYQQVLRLREELTGPITRVRKLEIAELLVRESLMFEAAGIVGEYSSDAFSVLQFPDDVQVMRGRYTGTLLVGDTLVAVRPPSTLELSAIRNIPPMRITRVFALGGEIHVMLDKEDNFACQATPPG